MSKESDQTVKTAIAAIRKEVGAEALEKINSHLKMIEHEFSDVFEDAQSFLGESVDRKNKLREKDREIEKLKDEAEKSKDNTAFDKIKVENEALKTQVANLKKFKDDSDKSKRDSFLSIFESIKDHKDFDKIKTSLKIPELKDEKIDWESMPPEEIASNLAEIEKSKNYGLFADIKITKASDSKIPKIPIPQKDPLKDPFKNLPGI